MLSCRPLKQVVGKWLYLEYEGGGLLWIMQKKGLLSQKKQ